MPSYTGTESGDIIYGSSLDDEINAFGGWDRVSSHAGNDTVYAGSGFDTVFGGDGDDFIDDYSPKSSGGNDRFYGGAGNDTLYGWNGGDTLHGNADNDLLHGEGGEDKLYGGQGQDTLHGGEGWDTLYGGQGQDKLYGGEGRDTLYGGAGDDSLYGGTDNDIYHIDNAGDLVVEKEDSGRDTVSASFSYTLTDNVESLSLTGQGTLTGTGNALANYLYANSSGNTLKGLAGNDWLYGGGGNDRLYSGSGNDFLFGMDGQDVLYGGSGNDTLLGGAGADKLYGGEGNDRYHLTGPEVDIIRDSGGTDTVFGYGSHTLAAGIENGAFNWGNFSEENPTVTGNSLDNVLTSRDFDYDASNGGKYTGGYSARLVGLAGNDTFIGGDGDDTFAGGSGTDRFYGGEGSDTVDYSESTASISANLGTGVVRFPGQSGSAERVKNVEDVIAGSGNDTLIGNAVANDLRGGMGNDTLTGGGGADLLGGGQGNDTFVFTTGSSGPGAADRIVAVDAGKAFDGAGSAVGDRIDLRGIDAISGGSDNAFKWGGTTTKSAGYIWLATVGTDTVIRGNTDSDSTAEFEVRIADGSVSHTAYTSADFLL